MTLYIILGVVAVIAIAFVGVFNKLAKLKVMVEEASSDIETFLKQRYDMIPNLVETVKGYAKHESGTFEKVAEMRSKAMSAGSLPEKMEAEVGLSNAISKLFAIAESYPELKANANFMELQSTLRELEESIQKSRRYYNGAARDFNTAIAVFPTNLIAQMFGYKKVEFFEASEEEQKNVQVKF